MQKMLDFAVAITVIIPRKIRFLFYNISKVHSGKFGYAIRYILLKRSFKYCGSKVIIGSNVTFKNIGNISIGSNVSIHENSYIDGYGGVVIRNNVSIAHNSTILSSTHTWGDLSVPIRENPIEEKMTLICDDVWIGCGVRIMAGTVIKSRSIIGANSVITSNVEENSIYIGVPGKLLKKI
jgi:acetyltransferase-like isoleucine patch superfamily enzyme